MWRPVYRIQRPYRKPLHRMEMPPASLSTGPTVAERGESCLLDALRRSLQPRSARPADDPDQKCSCGSPRRNRDLRWPAKKSTRLEFPARSIAQPGALPSAPYKCCTRDRKTDPPADPSPPPLSLDVPVNPATGCHRSARATPPPVPRGG